MPTYTYKFTETDETIDIIQSFSENSLTEMVHPQSGKSMAVKKVFHAPGVTGFKDVPKTVSPNYRHDRSTSWNSAQQE
tara:strand:+ start:1208 stop:1441 length:234 start_codon:yes stop_codon:yes gene_type:complete